MNRLAYQIALATSFVYAAGSLQAQEPGIDLALYQGMEWRNIGPHRGGRSVAVAGVVSDPLTYYFGGVGSGVWKTTDAGQSWVNVSDTTFGTSSVGAIAVAETDPNVVYVGMGENAVRGVMTSHGDGVYRSTDGGKTWRHLGLEETRHIAAIEVHPENPDLVYIAAQGAVHGPTQDRGVYRSKDGGATWEQVLYANETTGASSLSMDRSNPRILYAGMWDHIRYPWQVRSGGPGSGIYRSTDGGDAWEKLTEGFPQEMGKTSVAVSADPERIYALIEADPGGGVYRSDDGGKTWKNVNDNWTLRARAWYYIHILADPQNPDVVWIMNAPLMKSIDGGKSFTRVRTPHGDNHDLWINSTNSAYLINANDGGANVSLNGGKTWSTQQNQPTAQFYRVNTDNRFPYYVYGGQQDNSSVAIASRTSGAGIGWKDWYAVAGCETAYVAFDPDNPVRNYGGCYMGQIAEFDETTKTQHNVMAYPFLPAALASRDMKYRFNWNAPILVSQHDPDVIYHAANVLLKSTNRGESWVEVSPDLTRDEDEKQGPGGGPITNEGAGGETYGTIMYVAESPHDPNTLWTGSDDGLLHVTRDGGQNWENVTPRGLPEGIVNAIDVSPQEPGAAYVAFTRYKFNDFTPHIYRTNDYGNGWTRIVNGIAPEAHVRVVREDPVRRGLLYAGTEAGLYVSWNDGADWQSLQLNMPLTPITDLKIQRQWNDLVASTQGRSFWVLDDLSPLQQLNQRIARAPVHLFAPRDAYRIAGGGGDFRRPMPDAGKNPPAGVIIDFNLAQVSDSTPVTIEVLDASGAVVRTLSSDRDTAPDSGSVIKVKQGHNRVAWDLRHQTLANVPELYTWGSLRGRRMPPGTYEIRVTQGEMRQTQAVNIIKDPRVEAAPSDFREQERFIARVSADLAEIHDGVIRLRDVREQVENLTKRTKERDGGEAIGEVGTQLVDDLTAMEDSLVQKRVVDGQTVINFPSRLRFQYVYLCGAVDGTEGIVTEGARQLHRDLAARWTRFKQQLDELLGPRVASLNRLAEEHGIPAVIAPMQDRDVTTSSAPQSGTE
jgi:photosystem II stability/assembly factor-like uncharacterized protein